MVRPPLLKLGTMGPQPISKTVAPVFLPGEFYGQRSLVGYSPWGHKESDTTEQLSASTSLFAEERNTDINSGT